jgi:dihydrofolate reductase
MGKLIYSMITSLDGFVEGPDGEFGWGAPDEEMHRFIDEQFASVRTFLYGRRMYETMSYWETAHAEPGQPQALVDYARGWQAADKIVYSTTLEAPLSERTTIERSFDPDAVRRLKGALNHDLSIDGPNLAAQAIRAGLVDEVALIVAPAIAGGGKRFFPDGMRANLELLDTRSFPNGVVFVRYGVERNAAEGAPGP